MFVDILVSVIISSLIGLMSGELSLSLIIFGIMGGLLVDLDFLIWLYKNNWKTDKFAHEHRDLFHIPLLYTLALSIIWLVYLGPVWAVVWFVNSLWHFIHDTYSGGWGIRWLYPIHGGYWTLVKYSPKKYFKNKIDQREYAEKYGYSGWMELERSSWKKYLIYFLISVVTLVLIYLNFGW